jgi:hypothetical protein
MDSSRDSPRIRSTEWSHERRVDDFILFICATDGPFTDLIDPIVGRWGDNKGRARHSEVGRAAKCGYTLVTSNRCYMWLTRIFLGKRGRQNS